MAVEIGALRALLSLDSAAFEKGAKRAQASMNGLQRGLTKTADKMKSVGKTMSTRMTAPIVAATGLLVRSSLNTIDTQAKMAESMDTTVASLQVLARAADTAGISQNDLEGSLRRMTRRISLAAQGTGAGAKAFERLGLAFEDMQGLDAAERIKLIQERLVELVPEAERAGVASQIFGDKTGLAMTRLNADQITAAEQALARFGVTVTEIDADKIEEANDAISAIGLVTKGLGNQLTVALAPTILKIAETLSDLGEKFNSLSPEMKGIIAKVGGLTAALGPALIALGIMATAVAAIATPVGLVVAGITGLTIAVVAFWPEITRAKDALVKFGTDGIDWVKDKFNSLIEFFRTLPDQMMQIGEDIIEGLKDGIMQKWESVKGRITGIGTSISDGFKNVLGIQSPSKVFAEIGRNLMEGLGIGISQNTQIATDALGTGAEDMKSSLDGLGDKAAQTSSRFGDMVADIVTGSRKASDVLKSLTDQLIRGGISAGISGLAKGDGPLAGIAKAFAGMFDSGGFIPRGQFGIAGERGPEIVRGPSRVTSTADTARMLGGGGRPVINNISVTAPPGSDVQEQRRDNASGGQDLTVLIDQAVSGLARDPGSQISRTLKAGFGVGRQTRSR